MAYNGKKWREMAFDHVSLLATIMGTLLIQTTVAMQKTDLKLDILLQNQDETVQGISVSKKDIAILTNKKVYFGKKDSKAITYQLIVIEPKKYNLITTTDIGNFINIIVLADDNDITLINISNKHAPHKIDRKAHSSKITKLYPCKSPSPVFEFATGSAYGNVRVWQYKLQDQSKIHGLYEAPGTRNHLLGFLDNGLILAEQMNISTNAFVRSFFTEKKSSTVLSLQLKNLPFGINRDPEWLEDSTINLLSVTTQEKLDTDQLPFITAFSNNTDKHKNFALFLNAPNNQGTKKIIQIWCEYKATKTINTGIFTTKDRSGTWPAYLTITPSNINNKITNMHFTENYLVLITNTHKIFALRIEKYLGPLTEKEGMLKKIASKIKGSDQPKKPIDQLFEFEQITTDVDNSPILYSATNRGFDDELYIVTEESNKKEKLYSINLQKKAAPLENKKEVIKEEEEGILPSFMQEGLNKWNDLWK
jgi:hypothetical protein